MKKELKIIGIQANLYWEKPILNLNYFDKKLEQLPNDVDLVILPEMFTTGFTMHPENVAESLQGESVTWMLKAAKKFDFAITGSIIIKEEDKYYNRLLFVHPTGEINSYDKRHSFSLAGEHKKYTSGKGKLIVNFKGWKICPLICYDLRFPVWARNTENYDLLIYMANWPITRIKAWETLLKARAIENMSYVIGVNRVGKDANNYVYSGNSLIIDYLGEETSRLELNQPGIIQGILTKKEQDKTREKLGFLKDKDSFTIE